MTAPPAFPTAPGSLIRATACDDPKPAVYMLAAPDEPDAAPAWVRPDLLAEPYRQTELTLLAVIHNHGEDHVDFEQRWKEVSASATRMQNMLNELGICDDCGRRCDQGAHSDPVAEGTCTKCRGLIGVISSCCWSGPDSIWLHADTPDDDHEAIPGDDDVRRAHEAATAEDGDQADPLATLRQLIRAGLRVPA